MEIVGALLAAPLSGRASPAPTDERERLFLKDCATNPYVGMPQNQKVNVDLVPSSASTFLKAFLLPGSAPGSFFQQHHRGLEQQFDRPVQQTG